jgi:hypothetical protein
MRLESKKIASRKDAKAQSYQAVFLADLKNGIKNRGTSD